MYFPGKAGFTSSESRLACCTKALHAALLAGSGGGQLPAPLRHGGQGRQLGPCPPASHPRRQPWGARPGGSAQLLPSPSAAPRARPEPRRGGSERPQRARPAGARPGALAGLDEQGPEVSTGIAQRPPPLRTSRGGSGAASAVRISAAPACPVAAAGRLAAPPPPRPSPSSSLFPLVPTKPRSPELGTGRPSCARSGRPLRRGHGGDP